jgi:WD40 repeat protein
MSRPTNELSTRQQQLHELIADYLTALGEGRIPNRAELLAAHPELAADLMAFFTDHDQLEQIAEPMRPVVPSAGPGTPVPTAELPTVAPGDTPLPTALPVLGGSFGEYQLLEELARGGMGVVYKARQLRLNRLVALKMILAGPLASPADVKRFQSEAEAAANLDHPHIVPIFEVGTHEGLHYFSMKLIEGGSLAQAVGSGQWTVGSKEAERRAAQLLATVARAVHFAHQQRILHRDLKPANILLDAAGEPHVTDFGLAKRVEGDSKLTQSGAIVGTPSYMAPEQAAGKKSVGTAADVYGLGAILYELLTGQPPFRDETPLNTLFRVLHEEPARPRSLNARIDRDLDTICLKSLDKDPARRYGSAEAFAEDLERWLAGEPIRARRSGVAERTVKWAKRRPAIAGLVILLLAVATLGASGVLWNWRAALAARQEALERADQEREAREREQQARIAAQQAEKREAEAKHAALVDRDEKLKAFERAEGLRISAEASAARHRDPGLSLLLALDGVRRVPNHLTYNVLYDALDDLREVRTIPTHQESTTWVHYAPDGRSLVSLGTPRSSFGKPEDFSGRIWDAATGKERVGWIGYNRAIGAADLSPDGRRVAATIQGHQTIAYADGKLPTKHNFTDRVVYLWDPATGKETLHLRGHKDRVICVRFAPDGKRLVTGAWDNTARIWDAQTGNELHRLAAHQCSVRFVTFSPDARRVLTLSSARSEGSGFGGRQAGDGPDQAITDPGPQTRVGQFSGGGYAWSSMSLLGESNLAILWDANTGKQLTALNKRRPSLLQFGHVWHPNAAAISPDGKQVAIAFAENDAALWDCVKGGDELLVLKGHEGAVHDIAFSPDGKQLASAGADRTVRLWDRASGKELLRLRGHQGAVTSVRFRADGRVLLSTSEDRTARLWDAATGEERAVFKGHTGPVVAADFSPDGHHVVTAGDTTVRIWELTRREPCLLLGGQGGALSALEYSPDGRRVLSAGPDGTVRLWEASTGKELLVLGKGKGLGEIRSAHFSADGSRIVTASANARALLKKKLVSASAVHLWDAATGNDLLALEGHAEGALAAGLSPDGRLLFTVSDGQVRTISDGTKQEGPQGGLSGLKDLGKLMVQGGPGNFGQVRLWDVASGKLLATLPRPVRQHFTPTFSRDGRRLLMMFEEDRGVHVLDATSGQRLLVLRGHQDGWGDFFAAWSPDDGRIVSAASDGVLLWDAANGQRLAQFQGFGPTVTFAAFSPDASRLVTLAGNTGYVWNTATRELIAVLKGHEAPLSTAAFSPDGQQLVTGATDRTAILWQTATGKILGFYRGHSAAVSHVAFSPTQPQVATGSPDGTVRLWPTDVLADIEARRTRELTPAERDRYEVRPRVASSAPAPSAVASNAPLPSALPPPGASLPEPLVLAAPPLEKATRTRIRGQLDQLRTAVKEARGNPSVIRKELLALEQEVPGRPESVEAARLLMRLHSPYDALDPAKIPAEERLAGQPSELVAVLGEHRQRHSGGVDRLAVSRDGKWIASGGADKLIHLWQADFLRQQATLPGSLVGFGPDGHSLLTLADSLLRVWDLTAGHPQERAAVKTGDVTFGTLSPDGSRLVCLGEWGQVSTLWDLTSAVPRQLSAHALPGSGHTWGLAPAGELLARGSQDGKVQLWKRTGSEFKEWHVLSGTYQWGSFVVFSPDGRTLLTRDKERGVRAWELTGPMPRERGHWLARAYPYSVELAAFSADGKVLAASGWFGHGPGHAVKLWDITGREPVERGSITRLMDGVQQLVFTPDGRTLITGGACTVRFWDITGPSPRERTTLTGHTNAVLAVAFAPDRPMLASSGGDGTLRFWELAAGRFQERSTWEGGTARLVFTQDGRTLFAGSIFTPHVWDLSTGVPRLAAQLPGHSTGPGALACSADGRWLATGSYGPILRLWDRQAGQPQQRAEISNDAQGAKGISSLAFSPDGRLLVAGSMYGDRSARAWRVSDAGLKGVALLRTTGEIVAFSPDGKTLAYGSEFPRAIHLLDLSTPIPTNVDTLAEPQQLRCLAYSPDGALLASAGHGGEVTVWRVADGQKLSSWKLPAAVAAVAFADDGRHLAIGNANGTIYVLRLKR